MSDIITSADIDFAAQLHNNPNRVGELSSKDTFLLLLGPSGVGKSTIMRELPETRYIGPYTTRELRPGETDKIHVTSEEYGDLLSRGEILFSNDLYGVKYGTPLAPVLEAQKQGQVPILDFPLDRVQSFADSVKRIIELNFLCIYLFPPDVATWIQRMQKDGRYNESRLSAGTSELGDLTKLKTPHPLIDVSLVSRTGEMNELVASVRQIIQRLKN